MTTRPPAELYFHSRPRDWELRTDVAILIAPSNRVSTSDDCSQWAAPGEVIVPWNEPDVTPVAEFTSRSTVKFPWAPENRPVPPVMVFISTMELTPGVSVGEPWPTIVVSILSPLAATK